MHRQPLLCIQVMLENGLHLRGRPPDDCFEDGHLKATPGAGGHGGGGNGGGGDGGGGSGSGVGGASSGNVKPGSDTWARLGSRSDGKMKHMMNLVGKMMSGEETEETEGGEAAGEW